MWHPDRPFVEAWRALVINEPSCVHAVIDAPAFQQAFGEVDGDRLKRVPPGYPADHPEAELLKLKDVVFGRRLTDDERRRPTSGHPGRRIRDRHAGAQVARLADASLK